MGSLASLAISINPRNSESRVEPGLSQARTTSEAKSFGVASPWSGLSCSSLDPTNDTGQDDAKMTRRRTCSHLSGVVPVQARLKVEQPFDDHVDGLCLQPLFSLPLDRVLIEACLRYTGRSTREPSNPYGIGFGLELLE